MTMQYRSWISLKDMPLREESSWLPLIDHLEREHPELGPVASWDGATTMILVLAGDQPDRAAAAESAARIVSDALHATGLSDRFPAVFQVEPASDLIPA